MPGMPYHSNAQPDGLACPALNSDIPLTVHIANIGNASRIELDPPGGHGVTASCCPERRHEVPGHSYGHDLVYRNAAS